MRLSMFYFHWYLLSHEFSTSHFFQWQTHFSRISFPCLSFLRLLRLGAWNMFRLSQYILSISMTTSLRNDETQRIHSREISFPLSKKVPPFRGSIFYISMPKMCFACLSCKRLNDYFSQKRWDTKNSNAGDLSSTLQKSALSQRVVFLRLNAWNMFRASQYISSVSMTTFPRNDETQRTHSTKIPPPLSKKVSRFRGFIPSHLSHHCLIVSLFVSLAQIFTLASQPLTLERMGFSARVREKRSSDNRCVLACTCTHYYTYACNFVLLLL